MAVFHDEVAIEKAKGLFVGRGCEADDRGVEVFQDAAPEVVDAAMTFIGEDDVEGFDGNIRVITFLGGASGCSSSRSNSDCSSNAGSNSASPERME
jgi:hypothetical protein